MKYAIIIPDGASDDPLPELGGKTPLQVARTPNMDWLAHHGRLGTVRTIPDGFESGSDVAIMCLLGYDPKVYHSGRAPLEAAAQRIPLSATDWVFRCNLVTVTDGIMKDHSAGGITDAEAKRLIGDLAKSIDEPGLELHCGVSYRNLLVYRGKRAFQVTTTPPHEIPDQPADQYLPKGQGSEMLREIMAKSAALFARHEVNLSRRERGLRQASQVWLWGQGHAPKMPTFQQKYGVNRCAMITAVDLLRGLGTLLGWDLLNVEGMTSFHDTNYAGQGAATAAALDQYDLVLSHVEAPDEASHQADYKTKIAAIEHIDLHIVAPVIEKLQHFPQWRLMVLPDHPTNVGSRKHGYAPTCFGIVGSGVKQVAAGKYAEPEAKEGVHIERGEELMQYFLTGGGD